jgi:hypothetical protein
MRQTSSILPCYKTHHIIFKCTVYMIHKQEQTLQRKFRQSRYKFRIKVNNKDKSGKFADKF